MHSLHWFLLVIYIYKYMNVVIFIVFFFTYDKFVKLLVTVSFSNDLIRGIGKVNLFHEIRIN